MLAAEVKLEEKRYVGVRENLMYGVANGGQVFGYNIFTTYVSFFFVTVFGIPPAAVALMVLVTGIWDTINDPIMGGVIDKTRTRYGKLRPYLLFIPLPLAVVTVLFFSGPVLLSDVKSVTVKIVWMYFTYILWEFFYTIGDVSFWGMSAAISPSAADRTRAITSARLISGIIGGLVGILLPAMIDLSNHDVIPWDLKTVFMVMGLIAGVFGMGLFSLAGIFTRERVVQSAEKTKISDSFKYLFANKPLLLLIVFNVIGTLGGIGRVLGSYYYIMTLGFASLAMVASIPGIVSGFGAYAFIPKLRAKFTPKQLIFGNTFFRLIVISATFFIGLPHYTDAKWIVPIIAVQNFFLSMSDSLSMVVPTAMIGDTVDYMEWKTGKRSEGMSFAVLTFISKLTSSLSNSAGTLCIGLVGLQSIGGDKMIKNVGGVNTDFWLWAFFTIIPAALSIFQIVPLLWYDLQGEKLNKIQTEMQTRRQTITKQVSGDDGTGV